MKKIIFVWMVVMVVVQIKAESPDVLKSSVKQKCKDAAQSTKEFTVAAMYRLQDRLHDLRKPNYIAIEKSLDAINLMRRACPAVKLNIDTEVELLKNIEALGFDRSNATKALALFEDSYQSMQLLMIRYKGFAPWNWTKKMEHAAHEVSHWITQTKMYTLYFEGHKSCLQAWELEHRYQDLNDLDMNNLQAILETAKKLHETDMQYYLLNCVDQVSQDLKILKMFLRDYEHKKVYPDSYQNIDMSVSNLDTFMTKIKMSAEYSKQVDDKQQELYRKSHPSMNHRSSR